MSVHRVVLSSVGYRIATAMAGAAFIALLIVQLSNSRGPVHSSSKTSGYSASGSEHAVAQGSAGHGEEHREPPDLRAHTDMRAYAIRNGIVFDSEEKLMATPDWNAQWLLFHVDLHTVEGVCRVYEAVSRNAPERRFTAMWASGAQRATDWTLVRP